MFYLFLLHFHYLKVYTCIIIGSLESIKEPSHVIQQYVVLSLLPFAIFWEEFALKTSVITFYGIRYFCGQYIFKCLDGYQLKI